MATATRAAAVAAVATLAALAAAASSSPAEAAQIATSNSIVDSPFWYPLLLSTLAGASTAVGGALAVARRPDEGGLAFLLGAAIGVMATVSAVELWIKSGFEHGFLGITVAVAAGAALFAVLDPLLPKPPSEATGHGAVAAGGEDAAAAPSAAANNGTTTSARLASATSPSARSSGGALALTSMGNSNKAPGAAAAAALEPPSGDGDGDDDDGGGGERRRQQQQKGVVADDVESAGGSDEPLRDRLLQIDDMSVGGAAGAGGAAGPGATRSRPTTASAAAAAAASMFSDPAAKQRLRHHSPAQLMRLGTLMAIALTAHNLPEGCAVAFSTLMDQAQGAAAAAAAASSSSSSPEQSGRALGPLVAVSIAIHNIAEGAVISSPIYAASGSRLKAVGIAALSGMSEPLGALLALLVAQPLIASAEARGAFGLLEEGESLLPFVLAAVGGVMLAVCALELWPEARACQRPGRMAQGVLAGCVVMGWTLWAGA